VIKTASPALPATANLGDTVTYTITVTAGGTGNSTGVTLADTLPPRTAENPPPDAPDWTLSGDAGMCTLTTTTTNSDPDPDGNVLQVKTSVVLCNFGTMPSGTSKTIVLTTPTVISDCFTPVLNNTAMITATSDTNLANNQSTAQIVIAGSCPE
jgi:uncharacterized repeat protein (TIGR01451 family)